MSPRSYRSPIRNARAHKTRSRILDAALDILSSKDGLAALSLESVAEGAGVARMTVYNQFGSRRGLLEATFDELALRGGLTNLPDVFRMEDPRQAVGTLVTVYCDFWSKRLAAMQSLNAAAGLDPEIEESIRERNERRRHGLRTLVDRLPDVSNKADLVDSLFALTSAPTYRDLSTADRDDKAVEALIQKAAEALVDRYSRPQS